MADNLYHSNLIREIKITPAVFIQELLEKVVIKY